MAEEDFWLPLVDEPIGELVARLQAEDPEIAALVGSPLQVVTVTERDIASTFPRLIRAAEGPVLDTACACMVMLAFGFLLLERHRGQQHPVQPGKKGVPTRC